MADEKRSQIIPEHFGVPRVDPGWIYAVRTGNLVKVGKTTDPQRRLLREANTWCPHALEQILAKPFWNIRKLEYSLHAALAEHWHRGEWHKFEEAYWLKFFMDAFDEFSNEESKRDLNSVNFIYWMNGTNYVEAIEAQCEHRMTLRKWREHRGDPWRFTRKAILEKMREDCAVRD
ncbi:MAG TPA: GIY-YIG nuclease family protein [Xanthobacteraceae bacterium]|jgi:hypothetical protein|nr:GIY-YIG nuclease family protein [Xanthobacteraceae bacterium]